MVAPLLGQKRGKKRSRPLKRRSGSAAEAPLAKAGVKRKPAVKEVAPVAPKKAAPAATSTAADDGMKLSTMLTMGRAGRIHTPFL